MEYLENRIVVIDVHKLNEVKVNGDHLVIHMIDLVDAQFVVIMLIQFSKPIKLDRKSSNK
jgi:hypothetical protein